MEGLQTAADGAQAHVRKRLKMPPKIQKRLQETQKEIQRYYHNYKGTQIDCQNWKKRRKKTRVTKQQNDLEDTKNTNKKTLMSTRYTKRLQETQ